MARVRVPLVSDYRARRGLHRMPSWLRAAVGILVLLVSAGLHVAFVVTAFGISRLSSQKTVASQQVAIEVHERQAKPKEPPPPPKEPAPEVKPERVVPVRQAAQPKVEAQPKEAPKPQLARVVGLSFESTVGEGAGEGEGPAFGVGNTRMGDTAKTAAPPKDVPKQTINKGPTTVKPVANAVATRIPVAGVVFARKRSVRGPNDLRLGARADLENFVEVGHGPERTSSEPPGALGVDARGIGYLQLLRRP